MHRWHSIVIAVVFFGCGLAIGLWMGNTEESKSEDMLYQVSTIDALLQGSYEGIVPFGEVKRHGDFGIATLDSLDGEMVAVDGEYFQARADGTVVPVADDMTTPFGTVTWFSPDFRFPVVKAANFSHFTTIAEEYLPSRNHFYAVRIDGTIPYVKTRSIPRQEKPYPRLVDASANQSVFEFRNTTGTVAGFWTPLMAEGLNVPGFHLHYISADRTEGGHILDFILENATVVLDITPDFTMVLPTGGTYADADLSGDLSGELALVEQGRS